MRKYFAVLVLLALLVLALAPAALAAPDKQGGGQKHTVAWGESLTSIATQYGVSVEAILYQNGLSNADTIYVGQTLFIPGGAAGGPGWGPPGGYGGCGQQHMVRMGETLSGIAWQYGCNLQDLQRSNNLYNQDMVYVGQTLCIPSAQPGYSPQPVGYPVRPTTYYHKVVAGETLSSIAARYGMGSWSIAQANGLSNAEYIWVGQNLVIPGYQPQPVYQPPAAFQPPPGPRQAPGYAPPAGPKYVDAYDDPYTKPSYQPPQKGSGETPAAPSYQPSPASAPLPEAEHPITVVVNGGETWAVVEDTYYSDPDPDGITTLIVHTDDELGKVVRVRSGDYEVKGETVFSAEFGVNTFTFRYIPPGNYDVWIDDPDTMSEIAPVKVNSGERVDVFFSKQVRFQGQTYASPEGWVLSNWENPSKPGQNIGGWSNILVKTPASGLNVMIESEGGGYKAKCFTGSKGPGACDFAGLMAGIYYIWIDGTDLTLKTYMDGAAYAVFEFGRQ